MSVNYDFTSENGMSAEDIQAKVKRALKIGGLNPRDFKFNVERDSLTMTSEKAIPGRVADIFDEDLTGITWTELFESTASARRRPLSRRARASALRRRILAAKESQSETKWFRLGASITATKAEWDAVKKDGAKAFVSLLKKNGFTLDGECYEPVEDGEELSVDVSSANCKVV